MRKTFFILAGTGWALGLIVHILSILDIDLSERIPFVWVLHIGVFVVWIPMIIQINNNSELKAFQKSSMFNRINPIGFLRIIFKKTPVWLALISACGLIYAIVSFLMVMGSQPGIPDIRDGQYILQNHGQLIKTLTEDEYHHHEAIVMRSFSGHWIAFYGIATAFLYPFGGQINNKKI